MYKPHPSFIQPDNEEVKVWRYMDFTKLVSLLDTRRLYFARADKFDDPFEGSWPKINVEGRKQIPKEIPDENKEKFMKAMDEWGRVNKHWPRYAAINCWHENEHESAAMWKLYLKSDEGIAIQSTYIKLKNSFIDEQNVFIGRVNYIDYDTDYIKPGNIFGAFVHKRISFEHEREIRALIMKWPPSKNPPATPGDDDPTFDFSKETITNGLAIETDIEKLIEKIYVAPNAPGWFAELVDAVVKRYGYKFQVTQSEMNNSPLF